VFHSINKQRPRVQSSLVFLGFPISSISPYISLKHTKKALIGEGSEVCESFLTHLSTQKRSTRKA
jgi:hypothetical protein